MYKKHKPPLQKPGTRRSRWRQDARSRRAARPGAAPWDAEAPRLHRNVFLSWFFMMLPPDPAKRAGNLSRSAPVDDAPLRAGGQGNAPSARCAGEWRTSISFFTSSLSQFSLKCQAFPTYKYKSVCEFSGESRPAGMAAEIFDCLEAFLSASGIGPEFLSLFV